MVRRIWPYDSAGMYSDDMALKFLAYCDYDVFFGINQIESQSQSFMKFCSDNNLLNEKKLANAIKYKQKAAIKTVNNNKRLYCPTYLP